MPSKAALFEFLDESARLQPEAVAAVEPGVGEITYAELAELSDRLRDRLYRSGVRSGDRVGIHLHKSIDSLAAVFGILKTGAAYVPVDPDAPPERNAYILADCAVKAILVEADRLDGLQAEPAAAESRPEYLVLAGTGGGEPLRRMLESDPAPSVDSAEPDPERLAYILYTSGSTGKPKGVMLTHRAAVSFVDWCSEAFAPVPEDCFSSHAPFHFDLSILDIYVPVKHGARVILISEEAGKDPLRLAPLIAEAGITVWYSTPSILSFLTQFGRLQNYEYPALRTVLFAGEVFPVKHLRKLKELLPAPDYFNLYGPTETNVCTYHPIPDEIPEERTRPYPIGAACTHYRIKVIDADGNALPAGEEGELAASSPGMMEGYWNLPERSASAFLADAEGVRWYRTGDIVVEGDGGVYTYVGRRDRMVKRRGYRVELGEIEAGLYRHPAVREAAVIALEDDDHGVRTLAFLSCKGDCPSVIELKRFCMENLPAYMVPDLVRFLDSLPKTSTDKVDYQGLKRLA